MAICVKESSLVVRAPLRVPVRVIDNFCRLDPPQGVSLAFNPFVDFGRRYCIKIELIHGIQFITTSMRIDTNSY